MGFWDGKKAMVTGGVGFIGSHTVEMLVDLGAKVTVVDNMKNSTMKNLEQVKDEISLVEADITDLEQSKKACSGQDVVLNLVARVGGIGYNQAHPGTMFRDNVLMSTTVLEAARLCDIERFLVVSSACVYPRDCTIPTPETEGFLDDPEPTNFGYGWAKRVAEVQARSYQMEYGMKIAIARPYNAYGPRDHFDPETSHVIPALIKRIFDGENPLSVWGSGEQTRAFLYVKDFARGLIETVERYPECDAVNVGTDEEISIKDLVYLLLDISGKRPEVYFDTSKPSGQPRRNCDTTKAKEKVGYEAHFSLREGLKETVDWYRQEFGF